MKKLLLLAVCAFGLFAGLRAQEETITVGSGGTGVNYSPIYPYQKYSMTQQIFVADEMQDKSGKITSVAFSCTNSRSATRNIQVYMVNTDKTSFGGSTDWVTVTSSDLVYEGYVTFVANAWTTITFQTPFTYKKGKNVLLCVNDITASYQDLQPKYAADTKSENRLLYVSNWDNGYDATNMTAEGTVTNVTNQVQFTIEDDGSGEQLDPAPEAPANLKAEVLSDTEIQLTWDASANATSYKVYQNGSETALATVFTTTYTAEGLTPATEYSFIVTAVGDQESEKTSVVTATTLAKQAAATTFVFDFNDGTKDGMRVFQGADASHLCPNWGTPQDHSSISTVIESLNKVYKGVDGTTAVYSMTIDMLNSDALCTPDNYIVTSDPYLITETSTLEWDIRQVGEDKEDQYAIVVSEDGTNFEVVWFERYRDAGATKAYSLADYAGKELYIGFRHYQITDGYALTLDNVKLVTNSTLTPEEPIDLTAPVTPDNVKAIAFSKTTIKVKWNAAANATKYNVYQGDEKIAADIEATEYMVEGLTAGTNYCFSVSSANEEQESAKSAEVCETTFEDEDVEVEKPATPQNFKIEALVKNELTLSWDAVEGATEYNIYEGDVVIGTITQTICDIAELESDTEYCFSVSAVNKAGESDKTEEVCETTLKDESIEELTSSYSVYPNPVENMLFIEADANVEEVSVYNVNGQQTTVNRQQLSANSCTIDVENLTSGVYFIKVRTENGESVQRFIKK